MCKRAYLQEINIQQEHCTTALLNAAGGKDFGRVIHVAVTLFKSSSLFAEAMISEEISTYEKKI